jgi:hypothetical protein
MLYANSAIEFAALAEIAQTTKYHLFALAIELAFKSLALRVGATPDQCKNAGHRVSKIIKLIGDFGVTIPSALVQQLADDEWFKSMLDDRYPNWGTGPFVHSNYPQLIAGILEVACPVLLTFDGGSAHAELMATVSKLKMGKE